MAKTVYLVVAKSVTAILLLWLTSVGCCSSAAAEYRVEDVLKAIRSHRATAFVIEWHEGPSMVDAPERAEPHPDGGAAERPGQQEMKMLAARIKVMYRQPGTYRLVVDGNQMRFEVSTFEASMTDVKTVVPLESVQVFNGKLGKTLFRKSAGSYPRGRVAAKNEKLGFEFEGALPIVAALRGDMWLDTLGRPRGPIVEGVLEDQPIAILAVSGKYATWTLWCDPKADFHIRRIESHDASSVLRTRYDVSYSRDERRELWIPARWKRVSASRDGALETQKLSEVVHCNIGDAVSSKEFDIEFPPGTWVRDAVIGRSYIVLKDGNRRVVTPAEEAAGLTYHEILEGPDITTSRTWSLIMPLVITGVVIIVLLAGRHYQRRNT